MRGDERIPKLYWKFGVMNSSKTAQVLMTKFNYEVNLDWVDEEIQLTHRKVGALFGNYT